MNGQASAGLLTLVESRSYFSMTRVLVAKSNPGGKTVLVVRWAKLPAREPLNRGEVLEAISRHGVSLMKDFGDGRRVDADFDDPLKAVRAALAALDAAERLQRRVRRGMPAGAYALPALSIIGDGSALADPLPASWYPGEITIEPSALEDIKERVVLLERDSTKVVVALREPRADRVAWRPSLGALLAIVGAGAALAAWLAVVGGFILWARFTAAEVPAFQGISVVPHTVLIAEGLRALVVPLLLGGVAAGLGYSLRRRGDYLQILRRTADPSWLVILLPIVVLTGYVLGRNLGGVHWAQFWGLVGTTLVVVGGAVLAILRQKRVPLLPLVLFVVVAVWSGVSEFLLEWGSKRPRLDLAFVTSAQGATWPALFIARTSDAVYVARKARREKDCRIVVLPTAAVRELRISRRASQKCPEETGSARQPQPQPEPPPTIVTTTITTTDTKTVSTTVPSPTVTVSGGIVTIAPITVTQPPTTVPGPTQTQIVTTTTRVPVPAGARKVDDSWSIPVASVRPPDQLMISPPRYSRSPLRDTRPLMVTFTVRDRSGYLVVGAGVFIRAMRSNYFPGPKTARTDAHGDAKIVLHPTAQLPFENGVRVALFVRAWNPNESILGGVSNRRLIQLGLGSP
jgi:hypothetical protein